MRRFLPKYLLALLGSLYLFTAGVFSRKHRFLIFQIAQHFGFKRPETEMHLPTVPLEQVLDSPVQANLLELEGQGGNVTLLELLVISTLARKANPPIAFEIGTFDGRTALNMAANLPPGGQVHTLDLPRAGLEATKFKLAPDEGAFVDKPLSGARFVNTEYAAHIHQHLGDSARFDFSPFFGTIGLVFVDGSHSCDYVMSDSAAAMKLLAPGGIILWHDYQPDWPDVIQALDRLAQSDPNFADLIRIAGTSLVMLRREDTHRPT